MNEESKITFSEVYDQSGSVWVSMKIELPGEQVQFVDFNSISQVEDCADKILNYLTTRRNSPLDSNGNYYAAEAPEEYE